MLRLRGDDRVAIITAPLSMTVVIGRVPAAVEAGIILGALTAPRRLWKPCPSRSLVVRWRDAWFLSPFQGWLIFPLLPTAYAVGCILAPLRGWGGVAKKLSRGWKGVNEGKVVIALSKYW